MGCRATHQAVRIVAVTMAQGMLGAARGQVPDHVVNTDVLKHPGFAASSLDSPRTFLLRRVEGMLLSGDCRKGRKFGEAERMRVVLLVAMVAVSWLWPGARLGGEAPP